MIIAVFGAPLAGKTTILNKLAKSVGVKPSIRRVESDGEHHFPHIVLDLAMPNGITLSTIPGSFWDFSVWVKVLTPAEAIMLVVDAQGDRNQQHLDLVRPLALTRRGCIGESKLDLRRFGPGGESWLKSAELQSPFCDWPRFTNDPASVAEAIAALTTL